MKHLFIMLLSFVFTSSICAQVDQTVKNEASNDAPQDTVPYVVYEKDKPKNEDVSYYLNGQLIQGAFLQRLDKNQIVSVEVEKEKGSNKGKILIKTKKGYQIKMISLIHLHEKYLENPSANTIYFYDNELVKEDYEQFQVDEKYIHRIEVASLPKTTQRAALQIVKIYSRSEANLKKDNQIMIRGN